MDDGPDRQAEGPVYRFHPVGIPPGEVVIDGDDVHRHAAQGQGTGRQRGGQGFAFAGFHLRHHSVEQNRSPHQLNVPVLHIHGSPGGFAHQGKSARHQALLEAFLPQILGQAATGCQNLFVTELFDFRRTTVDGLNNPLKAARPGPQPGRKNPPHGSAKPIGLFQARLFALRIDFSDHAVFNGDTRH